MEPGNALPQVSRIEGFIDHSVSLCEDFMPDDVWQVIIEHVHNIFSVSSDSALLSTARIGDLNFFYNDLKFVSKRWKKLVNTVQTQWSRIANNTFDRLVGKTIFPQLEHIENRKICEFINSPLNFGVEFTDNNFEPTFTFISEKELPIADLRGQPGISCEQVDGLLTMCPWVTDLLLSGSTMDEIPESCKHLETLYLENCSVKSFESISNLKRLVLINCSKIESLPGKMPNLVDLFLLETSVSFLPLEMPNLKGVFMKNKPSSIEEGLKYLEPMKAPKLATVLLHNIKNFKGICNKLPIEYLDIEGCENLRTVPKFPRLRCISIVSCKEFLPGVVDCTDARSADHILIESCPRIKENVYTGIFASSLNM